MRPLIGSKPRRSVSAEREALVGSALALRPDFADERSPHGASMLHHTAINVSDLGRSRAFYLAALAPLRYRICKEHTGEAAGFGVADGVGQSPDPAGDLWIIRGQPHTPRTHIAFTAAKREEVDAFHRAALAAGGKDNGPPGLRPKYHADYYGAFVLDPDGYNIEAVCHTTAGSADPG